ncbi:hypothetical protein [Arthrobacter sp. AQ5-05]|uniref:hypothetical protein n=1 Tax=Arthrobacter sp. AQ5-05 TaxID=2184581 RepID=UPI0018A72736|nr:hypothetical protein [Arthrobacter sp. AQ5-05]
MPGLEGTGVPDAGANVAMLGGGDAVLGVAGGAEELAVDPEPAAVVERCEKDAVTATAITAKSTAEITPMIHQCLRVSAMGPPIRAGAGERR